MQKLVKAVKTVPSLFNRSRQTNLLSVAKEHLLSHLLVHLQNLSLNQQVEKKVIDRHNSCVTSVAANLVQLVQKSISKFVKRNGSSKKKKSQRKREDRFLRHLTILIKLQQVQRMEILMLKSSITKLLITIIRRLQFHVQDAAGHFYPIAC